MKSYYIKSVNGKTVFEPREVPVPQPKAGEILVKVRAASLNRGEILASISLHSAEVPHPAGGDCAGEVHAVGEGVTAFKPGDRVLGRARGSFSEFVAMSVQQAALVPQRLTWEQAATVPISAITAYEAILGYGKLKSGETLLVVGAASGVGVVGVQIGKF
ncbi:MAG TPA: alcohol dehydrogenase catalytic domain-containing protein, partial [Burkholderiales bacterium]|nr:alcohol dehydrogenase catalytic domain-containing protein [Burkholderiales bacterium]